jgi:hypothetical protein
LKSEEQQRFSTPSAGLKIEALRAAEPRDPSTPHISVQNRVTAQQEPFVDAKAVAVFLSISRADVLRLT